MHIQPIAHIITPFREKFAVPRQASILEHACGEIIFTNEYRRPDSIRGLLSHTHYWLTWGFHQHVDVHKKLLVRPPRLGGNQRVGVFASRSPFRPNNLGLSLVRLAQVDQAKYSLHVQGVDMVSGTPIYDIKPYIPYADSVPAAQSAWADSPPAPRFRVIIPDDIRAQLQTYDAYHNTQALALITEILQYDNRPAYKAQQSRDDKVYATTLFTIDISWRIVATDALVTAVRFE